MIGKSSVNVGIVLFGRVWQLPITFSRHQQELALSSKQPARSFESKLIESPHESSGAQLRQLDSQNFS
jgi:hypothetical protein